MFIIQGDSSQLKTTEGTFMPNFLSKILSIGSDKEIKEYQRTVSQINDLEPAVQAMSDDELRGQTALFRER